GEQGGPRPRSRGVSRLRQIAPPHAPEPARQVKPKGLGGTLPMQPDRVLRPAPPAEVPAIVRANKPPLSAAVFARANAPNPLEKRDFFSRTAHGRSKVKKRVFVIAITARTERSG